MSYWACNGGGGHLGVTVFATGAGTKNFFEKLIVFGVLARAVENAKSYQLFEKIFALGFGTQRRCFVDLISPGGPNH